MMGEVEVMFHHNSMYEGEKDGPLFRINSIIGCGGLDSRELDERRKDCPSLVTGVG